MLIHLLLGLFTWLTTILQTPTAAPLAGTWRVTAVKNTFLELGVVSPARSRKEFATRTRVYLSSEFVLTQDVLTFPPQLEKTDGYSRTAKVAGATFFQRSVDSDETMRYPGGELECDYRAADTTCLVGNTFMNLLNTAAGTLQVFHYEGQSADKYTYKLCVVSPTRIGLFLPNADILLLLDKR